MKTLPDTHVREVSCCPSPVTIWQTLLTRLLDQHYGLTLNDTWDLRAPAPTPSHLRATVAIKGSFRGAEF